MIAGIICEYNPMHNGHMYHIEKTRQAGAKSIVCVMSGNFVQRGECASLDKYTRAQIAVKNGADIVLELPTPWACSSAQTFARGSVGLLDAFGVDTLSFGSEIEDDEKLLKCAELLSDDKIKSKVQKIMKTGVSYPNALSQVFSSEFSSEYEKIISNPNSTLAIEYIKQINILNKNIKILPIKREAVEHDSNNVIQNFASASLLRKMNLSEQIRDFVPQSSFEIIKEQISKGYAPCSMQTAQRAFLAKLRLMSKSELSECISDDTGLVSRVYESAKISTDIVEFYDNIKTKNYTHSRIRRETLNAFLGIDKTISKTLPPYIKVLAVNENGLKLLAKQKPKMKLPLVTKHSEIMKLDARAKHIYELECKASDMFALFSEKIRPCSMEQTNSMIILKDK